AVPNTVPESAQFTIYLSPHQSRFRLEFISARDETMSRWRMILAQARAVRALIGRVKPDAVYVPTLLGYFSTRDGIAQSLAWWLALGARLSRLHCEALLLGFPPAYGMGLGRSPFITRMAIRTIPFDVVHYIDPAVFDWVLSKVGGKAGRKARLIADPVEPLSLPTRSKARAMLRLPEDKKLIMSIGLQEHRKGADYLIPPCGDWERAEPASILLAGKLSHEIRQMVTNESQHFVGEGWVLVLDQYLSTAAFCACLAAGVLGPTPYRPRPLSSPVALRV